MSDIWLPKLGYPDDPTHPFNKQWDVFNSRKRILLVSGSRKSGKTHAILHRICRHLWETPGARVAVFAKSIKLAKDGGSWQELIDIAIPEWIDSNIGFHFTTMDSNKVPGPKTDASTKTAFFRIRNYYGGESEARLFSVDHDKDVASKVKNKVFSMIYFIELSMFKDPRVLTVTLPSLRMKHLRPKNNEPDIWHQWIGDTNPDEDLGNRSWFYNMWYVRRNKIDEHDEDEREFYQQMGLIEMFMKDNPHITRQEIIELKVSCKGDPALEDSYVHGIHGNAGLKRTRHFATVFSRDKHVIGEGQQQINVHPSSTMLYTGWDIGSATNHAAVIVDKFMAIRDGRIRSFWACLDELVYLQEHETLQSFVEEFTPKMDAIENKYKKKFEWTHWSDDTALNVWRPTSGTFDYLEVLKFSGSRINLSGAHKPPNSVRTRVQIIRRLLMENRLFVSSRCHHIIEMLENCRRGESEKEYVLWDKHKHVFDALSYILFMEMLQELQEEQDEYFADQTDPEIMSVPL